MKGVMQSYVHTRYSAFVKTTALDPQKLVVISMNKNRLLLK